MNVVPAGEGEILGDSPDRRVEVLSDHPSVAATYARFGARSEGADLHVHREHTDYFFVLSGELTIRVGPEGNEHTLTAGQLVQAPPLVVHGFGNTSDADVHYLNFHLPNMGFIDFMRSLRDGEPRPYDQFDPPADGGRGPDDAHVGEPLPPFSLRELGPGDRLEPSGEGTMRCAYVTGGELAAGSMSAREGAWIQLDPGSAERIEALTAAQLLVLDLDP